MKFQVIMIAISLVLAARCQENIVLDESDENVDFMVYFQRTNSTSNFLSCSGVFIKENYILTGATCVTRSDVVLTIRSGVAKVRLLGSGSVHNALTYHIHPILNIAVIEIEPVDRSVSPRSLGKISTNRFCTMVGWEGYNANYQDEIPLRMFSLAINNSTVCGNETAKTYCTRQSRLPSTFARCGGLTGAPLFCDSDDSLSGIVIQDNFCLGLAGGTVGGTFISIDEIAEWVNEKTSEANLKSFSIVLIISALGLLFQN